MIKITVNGESRKIEPQTSIADYLSQLQLNSPAVAVELNQQIAPRETHCRTLLVDGDVVEIVTLVGGG